MGEKQQLRRNIEWAITLSQELGYLPCEYILSVPLLPTRSRNCHHVHSTDGEMEALRVRNVPQTTHLVSRSRGTSPV